MRRRRIRAGLLIGLVVVVGWGLYQLGRAHAVGAFDYSDTNQQPKQAVYQDIRAANRRLQRRNQSLVSRVATLESALHVAEARASSLAQALAQAQDQLAALKKELAFYRGIVSPKNGDIGLRVQSISVEKAGKPNLYDLQLLLLRPMGYHGDVSGRVQIQLHGVRQGQPVNIGWSDLALDSDPELVFSFQYYQQIGGVFRLPKGVQPTRVKVRLEVNGNGSARLTRIYRWRDLGTASD